MTAPYKAMTVAEWFLAYTSDVEDEDADITNMKLQKLLYYAQGHYLAEYDLPLFNESIRAWAHGPVVPDVYHHYKDQGRAVLDRPEKFNWDQISQEDDDFLVKVWAKYGGYSASGLRNMTHIEAPWSRAFTSKDESTPITLDALKAWFSDHKLSA
ncbi:MAG: DUF4065 domain-containing protein [Propionibacteriaceae bacterium]|jgi:uncharacterized phage-associated protein|nr:DUF4065 domain-containing protein [Propionibacteriaceae bacterium]